MSDSGTTRDVSIGCGSLFLIALIVWLFSGPGKEMERDMKSLRGEVSELKVLVQSQSDEIRQLRTAIVLPKP